MSKANTGTTALERSVAAFLDLHLLISYSV